MRRRSSRSRGMVEVVCGVCGIPGNSMVGQRQPAQVHGKQHTQLLQLKSSAAGEGMKRLRADVKHMASKPTETQQVWLQVTDTLVAGHADVSHLSSVCCAVLLLPGGRGIPCM